MDYRIARGLLGLALLGAVVIFTAFPQFKPDWIQIGSGSGPRATNAKSAEACLKRAAGHILDEAWDEAIKELNEVIRLEPRNADAYFLRSSAWRSRHELDKALSDIEAVLRLTPDEEGAYYARAEIKFDQGQTAAALADMNEVIRLAPDGVDALCFRGKLREELCDYPGALADYQQAVRLDDEDPLAFNNLAWVLAAAPDTRLRDGARALKAATRAVELGGGKDWDSLDTLAAAWAENGNFPAAERCQSDALRLAPPEDRADLQLRLDLYKAKKPYRLPAATKVITTAATKVTSTGAAAAK